MHTPPPLGGGGGGGDGDGGVNFRKELWVAISHSSIRDKHSLAIHSFSKSFTTTNVGVALPSS